MFLLVKKKNFLVLETRTFLQCTAFELLLTRFFPYENDGAEDVVEQSQRPKTFGEHIVCIYLIFFLFSAFLSGQLQTFSGPMQREHRQCASDAQCCEPHSAHFVRKMRSLYLQQCCYLWDLTPIHHKRENKLIFGGFTEK